MNEIIKTITDTIAEMPACYHGENINVLMWGTCGQESHLGKYRKQINGEALSLMQIERPTFGHVFKRYEKLIRSLFPELKDITFEMLETNDKLAIVIARLKYWTIPVFIPSADDLPAIARYWKNYYNTAKGKGTVEQFLKNYELLVAPNLA